MLECSETAVWVGKCQTDLAFFIQKRKKSCWLLETKGMYPHSALTLQCYMCFQWALPCTCLLLIGCGNSDLWFTSHNGSLCAPDLAWLRARPLQEWINQRWCLQACWARQTMWLFRTCVLSSQHRSARERNTQSGYWAKSVTWKPTWMSVAIEWAVWSWQGGSKHFILCFQMCGFFFFGCFVFNLWAVHTLMPPKGRFILKSI